MKFIIFVILFFLFIPVNSKEVTGVFNVPAGNSGTLHKVPIDSDMYFGCEFDVSEYRNDGEWGPYLSLHYTDLAKEEAIAIHFTKLQDDFLVFNVTHREKRINTYEEKILTLKSVSDVISISMIWSNKVMYFDLSDNTGQASKFFVIAPKFTPEEASLSISGAKGTYLCNSQKILTEINAN